jgi:hypothetical protein
MVGGTVSSRGTWGSPGWRMNPGPVAATRGHEHRLTAMPVLGGDGDDPVVGILTARRCPPPGAPPGSIAPPATSPISLRILVIFRQ